jgi:hypothetical protein
MSQEGFPPQDISSFLAFCAGEWLALRSCFELDGVQSPATAAAISRDGSGEGALDETVDGDGWHSSERAELVVAYLDPSASGEAGGLCLQPPGGGTARALCFNHDGTFFSQTAPQPGDAGASSVEPSPGGHWQLWPDGSLELTVEGPSAIVRERIWFTKPNLRLRSSVEHRPDGSPGRASFSSEIRRVSRPNPAAGPATSP